MHAVNIALAADGSGSADPSGFYRHVLEVLQSAEIDVLVGGAYALCHFTGICRPTKDLDIFLRRSDYERAAAALQDAGYRPEMAYPHWLAKVHCGDDFVDVIFNSGNGLAEVDDEWFAHAPSAEVLDLSVKICPAEEMLWSKAFIMERERFDGADITHLIHAHGSRMDWARLVRRFDQHWRVLLSHLILFGYAYPGQRDLVPPAVMEELLGRLQAELSAPPAEVSICRGPLLSREQYLVDIEQRGYRDGRIMPLGNMTTDETAKWTDAIDRKDV
jgi:hypothetical protein